jgi:hypothetical protein
MNEKKLSAKGKEAREAFQQVLAEMGKVVVGQEEMCSSLVLGLLTGGHVLLEGLPGLAKTLAVKSFAASLTAKFTRIPPIWWAPASTTPRPANSPPPAARSSPTWCWRMR